MNKFEKFEVNAGQGIENLNFYLVFIGSHSIYVQQSLEGILPKLFVPWFSSFYTVIPLFSKLFFQTSGKRTIIFLADSGYQQSSNLHFSFKNYRVNYLFGNFNSCQRI